MRYLLRLNRVLPLTVSGGLLLQVGGCGVTEALAQVLFFPLWICCSNLFL